MIIKQLSIFLENKTGRINEVTQILGESGINLTAFSMAENTDFGVLRVIVSDPEKACAILKEHQFAVTLTDVICLNSPNIPGALSKALVGLANDGVFIEYMYAFASGDIARVIIRPNNIEQCIKTLQNNKLDLMGAHQFYSL